MATSIPMLDLLSHMLGSAGTVALLPRQQGKTNLMAHMQKLQQQGLALQSQQLIAQNFPQSGRAVAMQQAQDLAYAKTLNEAMELYASLRRPLTRKDLEFISELQDFGSKLIIPGKETYMCEVLTYMHNCETGAVHFAGKKENHSHSALAQVHYKPTKKEVFKARLSASEYNQRGLHDPLKLNFWLGRELGMRGIVIQMDKVEMQSRALDTHDIFELTITQNNSPWIAAEVHLPTMQIQDYVNMDSHVVENLYMVNPITRNQIVDAMNKLMPTVTAMENWFDANRDGNTFHACAELLDIHSFPDAREILIDSYIEGRGILGISSRRRMNKLLRALRNPSNRIQCYREEKIDWSQLGVQSEMPYESFIAQKNIKGYEPLVAIDPALSTARGFNSQNLIINPGSLA